MDVEWTPIRFVSEEIEVHFDSPPTFVKTPGPPDELVWRGDRFEVLEVLSSWYDFSRKGNMASNMQPHHLRTAALRGSWGVGRFYFRVRVSADRAFDIYYDRAPEDAGDRSGHWFLWRELEKTR